ncbi:hypothetical protein GE061_016060 [Apolygus lucorum]|uniref:Uncharacterized protein n=1 Tax=Apolygus lucorum TaxID=248454 RepID=A0A8S9XF59_APOLU|nr:hypothetical protein GE061_016060 [Apolygus lucorum]
MLICRPTSTGNLANRSSRKCRSQPSLIGTSWFISERRTYLKEDYYLEEEDEDFVLPLKKKPVRPCNLEHRRLMRMIFQVTMSPMSLQQHIKAITMEAATYRSDPTDAGAPANAILAALETHPIELQTGWRRLLKMFEKYVTEGPQEFPVFTEWFSGQEIAFSMIFSGQTLTKWAKFLKEFWVLSLFTRDYYCPITINPDSTIYISSTFANGIQPSEHADAADSGAQLGLDEKPPSAGKNFFFDIVTGYF